MSKFAASLAVAVLSLCTPAFAEDWKCDEANLTEMKDYVGKLDSKASQEEGQKEWDMAVSAMKSNKMDECNLRMGNVNKLLGGKNMERTLETSKDKGEGATQNNGG